MSNRAKLRTPSTRSAESWPVSPENMAGADDVKEEAQKRKFMKIMFNHEESILNNSNFIFPINPELLSCSTIANG
jgi:hypothetical protein